MTDTNHMKQQLGEAILAGERLLDILGEAEDALSGAEGWGMFDMLGGGLISTLAKRSKMKEAQSSMDDARAALVRFQRELHDVTITFDHELGADGFLTFADYVFDDFLSDFLVQRKINDAQKRMKEAKREVKSIVRALKDKYRTI